jgi:hypothetical protein
MNFYLVLLPAVSAFLGSGIATAVINHYLTSRRTREELLRSKLEELFLATSGFCAQVKSSSIPYLRAMQEEITYDQDNDLFLKGEDDLEGHFEKSQMLINLYYPQVLNLFSRLIAARDKADGVRLDFRDACACGERRPETARRFQDALVEFDELRDLLRITLAGLSRDMIKPPSVFVRVRRWFQQRGKSKSAIQSAK